ncbi:MAG: ATP-binding protein [Verrucomicrobiota bacterium]
MLSRAIDDAATLASVTTPVGFIRNLPPHVIIDEIPKAPRLFPATKLSVDLDRHPGRCMLTGSANVLTLPRLSESLAGRVEIIPLFLFSAGETPGQREGFLERLFHASFAGHISSPSPADLPQRLVRGGYPEAVGCPNEERRGAWFAPYLSTILHRDVRDLAQAEGLHALPYLLRILASRTAGLLNIADVGRDAGIPHSTLGLSLSLLGTEFPVHRLSAWSPNLGQRMVKAPRLHLVDTSLACHLVGADAARFQCDRPVMGRILETFVGGELRKPVSWWHSRATLHHFRTSTGSEVGVVLEKPDGTVAAVDVKAGHTVGASDFEALKALRDPLGDRFAAGVVLHEGKHTVPFCDRLWLLPVADLCR